MNNLVNPAFMNFIMGAADQTPQIYDQLGGGELWDDEPTINYQMNHQRKHNTIKENTNEEISSCANYGINNSKFKFPTRDGCCPICGEELILKNGKYGEFYSCSNFPECRYHCSPKQYEAALKYGNKREEQQSIAEPKKENPAIADVKIEVKPTSTTPCKSKTAIFNGVEYSNYLEMFCGECALYSHLNNKCIYTEWDVGKEKPACDMFVSNDKDERLETLEFLKAKRARKKKK